MKKLWLGGRKTRNKINLFMENILHEQKKIKLWNKQHLWKIEQTLYNTSYKCSKFPWNWKWILGVSSYSHVWMQLFKRLNMNSLNRQCIPDNFPSNSGLVATLSPGWGIKKQDISEKHDLMCFLNDCSSGCCLSDTWNWHKNATIVIM